MFFYVSGAFVEFERDLIHSCVNVELARVRARGVRLGRPHGQRKGQARDQDAPGGLDRCLKAKALGVGTSVVQRIKMTLA
jgi:hypothetical protein